MTASFASYLLHDFFYYSSTLKMEVTFSSETAVDFQKTARHFIPEDMTLF
jgi:hypothetical protein